MSRPFQPIAGNRTLSGDSASPLYPPFVLMAGGTAALLLAAAAFDGLAVAGGLGTFLALAAAAFRFPRQMLCAVIVVASLVPIELAVQAGGLPRIGPTRVVLAAFYAGWLLRCALDKTLPRIGYFPLSASIGLTLVVSVVSAFFSVSPKTSAYAILSLLFEQFGLLLAFCVFLRQPGFRPMLLRVLCAAAFLVCLFGFLEAFTLQNPLIRYFPEGELIFRAGMLRIRSTLFHPIALGCFLNLLWPFVFVGASRGNGPLYRAMSLGLLGAMAAALFMTISRGPWAACMIQTVVFFWGLRLRSVTRLWVACFSVFAMLAAVMAASSLLPGFSPAKSEILNPSGISLERVDEGSSEYYRIALFKAVEQHLEGSRRIYGMGPGTFYLAGIESRYSGHDHTLTAADSHVIRLFAETGILGLAAFLLAAGVVAAACIRGIQGASGPERAAAVAALAAVTGFLFENLTVSMFPVPPLGALYWMAAGIGIAAARKPADRMAA